MLQIIEQRNTWIVSPELTGAVQLFAISAAPGQLRNGNTNRATAQQDIVPQWASYAGDSRVHPGPLAPLQLGFGEKHSRQALWIRTFQPGVDQCDRGWWWLLKLDQIMQPAVTQPRVVMETCWGNQAFVVFFLSNLNADLLVTSFRLNLRQEQSIINRETVNKLDRFKYNN